MKVNKGIFRGYDIRGIVGEDLSPEFSYELGKAYGTYLKRQNITEAVVGRDSRATSPEYSAKVTEGLSWAGIDVIDIGMHLVGTFYWSQYFLKRKGGIYISASHNPPEYNGFKIANGYSNTLVGDEVVGIAHMMEAEDFEEGEPHGSVATKDITQDYIDDIIKRVPLKKKFKVVVDAGNATAGAIAPKLLRRAGCDVVEKNTDIDPTFPLGVADPTKSDVMERLAKAVVKEKADVGFSYDSDGDRIGIVDEKGNVIWADVLLSLFAIDVLALHPGSTIMYNLLCSKVVEDTVKEHGGKGFMWRVGYSFLKHKNKEVGGAFIGELSGHFFFSKDFYNHDDGLYATMRVLSFLSGTGSTLSEEVAKLPQYISSPEVKLYYPEEKKVALVPILAKQARTDFPDAEVIDDERAGDGIRLESPTSMFVIRYSQNGPYITIKFEAKSQKEYDDLKEYLNKLLHSYDEIDWESSINVNTEALT